MHYIPVILATVVLFILGYLATITCIANHRNGYREKTAAPLVLPKIASSGTESENDLCFDQFVLGLFDRSCFKLKARRGDTAFGLMHQETDQYPDMMFEYCGSSSYIPFAVECKWRSKFSQNRIEFPHPYQPDNYRLYQEEKNIPVFLVIGIGGSGSHPQACYIVPLKSIPFNYPYLSTHFLRPYLRPAAEKKFFLDVDCMKLK